MQWPDSNATVNKLLKASLNCDDNMSRVSLKLFPPQNKPTGDSPHMWESHYPQSWTLDCCRPPFSYVWAAVPPGWHPLGCSYWKSMLLCPATSRGGDICWLGSVSITKTKQTTELIMLLTSIFVPSSPNLIFKGGGERVSSENLSKNRPIKNNIFYFQN